MESVPNHSSLFKGYLLMFVAILQGQDVENELEIVWHCAECSMNYYGWTKEQYQFVEDAIKNNKPIQVPEKVVTSIDFGKYIGSLKF